MIKAWSYSRYSTYDKCPFKAKLLYIDGHKEPTNAAMTRGAEIHSDIESFLKDKFDSLSESVVACRPRIGEMRRLGFESEVSWAFTQEWMPCGWFDSNVWVRARIDGLHLEDSDLKIVDFKTGKRRDEHKTQANLYALCGFKMHPNVDSVIVQYLYVDSGMEDGYVYSREDDVEKLEREWSTKGIAMCSDIDFVKKPSKLCGWCHFNKNKEGLCEHS